MHSYKSMNKHQLISKFLYKEYLHELECMSVMCSRIIHAWPGWGVVDAGSDWDSAYIEIIYW